MSLYNPYGKRLFDIIFTSIGIIPILPIMGFIAFLIKLEDGGSIIFKQERIGYRFRRFKLYKFRTMVENAEKLGPSVTRADDPRITRIGRFLRKYKLDELPQLFNVLKGDISLVGPRPEVEKYVKYYEEDFKEILYKVKPGITDYATLEFRNEEELLKGSENTEKTYLEKVLPKKIKLYSKYAEEVSLLTDMKLIFKTLWRIIKE